MKLRIRRGITLMEVIIAFVLLSFIGVMVVTAITSSYTMSAQLNTLTATYYGAQNVAEREWEQLSSAVKTKYRLTDEITNTPGGNLDPTLHDQLNEVNAQLRPYPVERVTLFGKSVELYKFTTNYQSPSNQTLTLHAGVVNAKTLDRPVPIIDEVVIDSLSTNELFHSAGQSVSVTSVRYNEKNKDQRYREMYQWYISTEGYHTATYTDGHHVEETGQYGGTLYSLYPQNFTPLIGETGSRIQIKEEYYGQMLVCVVTPLGKTGAMGESVVSNYLYLSGLPKLSGGSTYLMVIDPSMETYAYDPSGSRRSPSNIPSRLGGGWMGQSSSSKLPTISLRGEATDSDLSQSVNGKGVYSRYISFSGSTSLQTGGYAQLNQPATVFLVAKNRANRDVDFLTPVTVSGGGTWTQPIGFVTNYQCSPSRGNTDTGWQLIQAQLQYDTIGFKLGEATVDVAEMVVVGGDPRREDQEKVWDYLAEKYNIQ